MVRYDTRKFPALNSSGCLVNNRQLHPSATPVCSQAVQCTIYILNCFYLSHVMLNLALPDCKVYNNKALTNAVETQH